MRKRRKRGQFNSSERDLDGVQGLGATCSKGSALRSKHGREAACRRGRRRGMSYPKSCFIIEPGHYCSCEPNGIAIQAVGHFMIIYCLVRPPPPPPAPRGDKGRTPPPLPLLLSLLPRKSLRKRGREENKPRAQQHHCIMQNKVSIVDISDNPS
jgi:hypothetical protein